MTSQDSTGDERPGTSDRDYPDEDPFVSIVVVNWNNFEETAECLHTLAQYDYPNFEVIVVDNGSVDDSGARLAEEFNWCEFVFNEKNLGFGGGCNAGIATALRNGAEYVLLINNDATTDTTFLDNLLDIAETAPTRIVGALIEDEHGDAVNGEPCHFPDMLYYSGYRGNLPFFPAASSERRGDWWLTNRVEGAGVILSADLLHERKRTVGHYLDQSLFMYCEEVELALWCRKHREPTVVTEHAVVRHEGGASSDRAFQLYYLTRNRVLIAHEYLDSKSRFAFNLTYALWKLAFAAKYAFKGKPGQCRAIIRGLCDGFRHRTGQVW